MLIVVTWFVLFVAFCSWLYFIRLKNPLISICASIILFPLLGFVIYIFLKMMLQ